MSAIHERSEANRPGCSEVRWEFMVILWFVRVWGCGACDGAGTRILLSVSASFEHHFVVERLVFRAVEGEASAGHGECAACAVAGMIEEVHRGNRPVRENHGGFC